MFNIVIGNHVINTPWHKCTLFEQTPVPNVKNVIFNLDENRQYELGLKSQYHNVDFTNITEQYTEKLTKFLSDEDMKGMTVMKT